MDSILAGDIFSLCLSVVTARYLIGIYYDYYCFYALHTIAVKSESSSGLY